MSMHQGMDLSRFKKVSSDKKSTTLRHSKGHEIKIAHSGLTPKMREKLNALAQHEETAVKSYAEGTPEEPVSVDDGAEVLDPQSPATAVDPGLAPQAAPAPEAQTLAPEAPQPQAQQQVAPQAQALPQPAVTPQANTIDVIGVRPTAPPKPTPQQVAQDMTNQDLEFQKYLAMGNVKPQTIQDLYAKKDTLGKIGTLFGLLVSGAGAGLTHQPNAVLEMMNKEIMNDFEAQKTSKTNAQNWYQLSKAHEMQKAQMEQMGVQNFATIAGTQKIAHEIAGIDANTRNVEADTALKVTTNSLNRMKIGVVQDLQDQTNKLPPGPQKDAAQNGLNLLSKAAMDDITNSNALTAEQIAAREKLRAEATPQPQQHDTGIDMDKLKQITAQTRANAMLGMEGAVNEKDLNQANLEAKDVAKNRAFARAYKESWEVLDGAFAAGTLNPQLRATMINSLAARVTKETAGGVSTAEAKALADGMFPSPKDWGGSREAKFQRTMHDFENNEAEAVTLERLGLKKPFPYAVKKKGGKHPYEGKTIVDKQGNRKIMKDGKWGPAGQTKQAVK